MVPNEADVDGVISLHSPKIKSWSYAKDYGTTSKAGAGAVIEGDRRDAYVSAEATGIKGCDEVVSVTVGIGGNLYQENEAGETGYNSGTMAQGINSSGLGFYAEKSAFDKGQTYSFLGYEFGGADAHLHGIEGKAITKGETFVTVDPYGHSRSAFATTENMSKVDFPNLQTSFVYGGGGVGAMSQKGSLFAGGNASFGYNGSTAGNGSATVNSNIHDGHNGSSAFVSIQANSVSD